MALTNETLRANAALATLTDEQAAAIVEMSQNDENATIGNRIGQVYRDLDADILASSGMAKEGDEKTYNYAKRVIGALKASSAEAGGLSSQVAELQKEKARLEKALADGSGDAETRKALAQARADLANVTREYGDLKGKYDRMSSDHERELMDVRMEAEFSRAGDNLQYRKDLPQAVIDMARRTATATVKGMNPSYIDDGNGGKVLAFMKDGTPLRNPETNLRPFTAAELVARELKGLGVLEEPRRQTGAGSGQTVPKGGAGGSVDVSGARTQTEATDLIGKSLMAQGLTRGSDKWQKAFDEAWRNNLSAIRALPFN